MKRHLLVALAAVLAVGISASMASAQCAFEHPKQAKKVQASLVQAFVSCGNPGGNSPNTTVGGSVPACKPPETFCEQSANCPGTGWEWDESGASGTVVFKSLQFCYGKSTGTPLVACSPTDPLNSAQGGSADLYVALKLKKVLTSGNQNPATGTGTLATVARATMNDTTNGDATVIDFPAGFQFNLVDGAANMKTSSDALLNTQSLAGLPPCTSIELVSVHVLDTNGDKFASIGNFLFRAP